MIKPRISRCELVHGYWVWVCIGDRIGGYGATPKMAYDQWRARV